MTTARTSGGGSLHFPPFGIIKDSVSVIEPPPAMDLRGMAGAILPSELLVFSRRLVQAAKRRERNPRWQKVNRARLELARLCLDRALSEGIGVAA